MQFNFPAADEKNEIYHKFIIEGYKYKTKS